MCICAHLINTYNYMYSFKCWLRMYADAVDLLRTAVVLKPDSGLPLLAEKEVVLALGGILSVGTTYIVGKEQITTAQSSGKSYMIVVVFDRMRWTQSLVYIYTIPSKLLYHSDNMPTVIHALFICACVLSLQTVVTFTSVLLSCP